MTRPLWTLGMKRGTFIDRIPPGKALKLAKVLGIEKTASLMTKVSDAELGVKDVIRLEGMFLKADDIIKIALIAPTAIINVVDNYRIQSSQRVESPQRVIGLLRCPNSKCITNKEREPIKTSFTLSQKTPLKLLCNYSNKIISRSEIED